MILFADLPDEISVYIDEFVKGQLQAEWRYKFTRDVISFIKSPKYHPLIMKKILKYSNDRKYEYKKYFYLHKAGLSVWLAPGWERSRPYKYKDCLKKRIFRVYKWKNKLHEMGRAKKHGSTQDGPPWYADVFARC